MSYNPVRYNAETVGFEFTRPPRKKREVIVSEPKEPRPKPKKEHYKVIHADDRHGPGWPRPARSGRMKTWTGWLTHREYNVLDFFYRFDHASIYNVGQVMDIQHDSCNRLFYNLKEAGLIDGLTTDFHVTPMGKILFSMTDQFMLQLDLEDEDECCA